MGGSPINAVKRKEMKPLWGAFFMSLPWSEVVGWLEISSDPISLGADCCPWSVEISLDWRSCRGDDRVIGSRLSPRLQGAAFRSLIDNPQISHFMFKTILPITVLLAVLGVAFAADKKADKAAKPLKILLIAGGCCHDYADQCKVLKAGIEAKINAKVTIDRSEDTSMEAKYKSYESEDWANKYDVVIHDECSAKVTDLDYVNRILDAHKGGTPAVNLHCAMHSYRWGEYQEPVTVGGDNAGWYEMIGIQSSKHGQKAPIDITFTGDHPITAGMEAWTAIDEELYNNVQVFEGAKSLANGKQMQMPKAPKAKKGKKGATAPAPAPEAKAVEANESVVWTNEYGPKKTKIFNTTLGHYTETVADDRYLDLVTRGILWTVGKLEDDGSATAGY